MTRSYASLGLIGSLCLLGCEVAGIDGNGQRENETREVAAFSRIRSDAELDVEITQGDQQSVTVSLDSNLLRLVDTRIDGDTLYVDLHENVDRIVAGPHLLITVPGLRAAKLAGSGSLTLTLDEPSSALDLYLSGSGDLRFAGTTAALGAYLSGSGDIRLEGATSDAELALSGSGSIRAQPLAADSASIALSGSGDISATVQSSVQLSLSGSGDINLYGDASIDERRNTGSGELVRH